MPKKLFSHQKTSNFLTKMWNKNEFLFANTLTVPCNKAPVLYF